MKNFIYLIVFSLFICLSCEKEIVEPLQEASEIAEPMQEASLPLKFSPEVLDYILKQQESNNSTLKNNGNKNNGPYWVAMYSDFFSDFEIFAQVSIPNSDMGMFIKYPTDGVDRALVNGEWIMSNWNISGPYVFIVDFSDGSVVYSNWCEEIRSGHYHQRVRGKLIELDLDGDGLTDIWRSNSLAEDSDGTANLLTDLTDGQISDYPFQFPILGNCQEATTEIRVQGGVQIKNGFWKKNIVIDGVRYKNF